MDLKNIIEKRKVKDGKHSLVLEVKLDDFKRFDSEFSDELGAQIVNQHLYNNSDDGRATNVTVELPDKNKIVRIYSDISYEGNDHTNYGIH